MTLVSELD